MSLNQRGGPGVAVEAATIAQPEAVVRMDIAHLVGFAACGPVDLPVALHSLAEFEAVFGTAVVLACDPAPGSTPLGGLLHPAVQAFFAQGGQRCWITRVAGDSARSNRFALQRLLRVWRPAPGRAWRFEPASLQARSPGAWSDRLQVACGVQVAPLQVLPLGALAADRLALLALGREAVALQAGDLLRFALAGGFIAHARIAAVEPAAARQGRSERAIVLQGFAGLVALGWPLAPPALTHLRLPALASDDRQLLPIRRPATGRWLDGAGRTIHGPHRTGSLRLQAELELPPEQLPAVGDVVGLSFAGDRPRSAWMALASVVVQRIDPDKGLIGVQLQGRPWSPTTSAWRPALQQWALLAGPRPVDWLRAELQVLQPGHNILRRQGLGLGGPSQPDADGTVPPALTNLPDDQTVFSDPVLHDPGRCGGRVGQVGRTFEPIERDALGRMTRRFPLAALPALPDEAEQLLLPLEDAVADPRAAIGRLATQGLALERDGLQRFSWRLFAEPALAELSTDALAAAAAALHARGQALQPLRGLHAVLGGAAAALSAEVTLLLVPDAVLPGWQRSSQASLAPIRLPPPPPQPPPPPSPRRLADSRSQDPQPAPLAPPEFIAGPAPDLHGSFLLRWTRSEPALRFTLQEADDAEFSAAVTLQQDTALDQQAVVGKPPGTLHYRVRAEQGPRCSDWSATWQVTVGHSGHSGHGGHGGYTPEPWAADHLLALHRLMLRTAAARGDLLALLALPRHCDDAAAIAHAAGLRNPADTPLEAGAPPPLASAEACALGFGALHHPWLLMRDDRRDDRHGGMPGARRGDPRLIAVPPDAVVAGQLAAAAWRQGAWRAVANQPLRDVVALAEGGGPHDAQALLAAQVNPVRATPRGLVVLGADTLSADPDGRPISVHRLMALLRRLALQHGARYLPEPDGAALQRSVERGFEALMDEMFRCGAFAGSRPEQAFRVEVSAEAEAEAGTLTRERRDAGSFWVELKVAPALPLCFLTLRLVRSGERLAAQEGR